jgi:hypothetical protein
LFGKVGVTKEEIQPNLSNLGTASQVPEIDFNESFAPILNDSSFRIMLIAKIVWNMTYCG